jgi:prepilin-type N-terminal cleavage/methylation domain-containing protein
MDKKFFKKYSGLTLIELIMAMAILVIGMEGFSLLFVKIWKNNSYILEMGQSSIAVSQGLNKITDYVRNVRQGDDGSYPIQSADDNNLTVFSDYDRDSITERLHFYKNDQDILMGVTNPTVALPKTYPSGDQQVITIVSNIINDASVPVFYYYNQNYPADTINNPVATPALTANIRLVKIYLETNIIPNRAPDNIKIQSFVEMRNLNDYDRID